MPGTQALPNGPELSCGAAEASTEQPLVSIVTPAHNQAGYLREAIESVLRQDYPRIEYFVVNDGSTDDTERVGQEYAGRLIWESQPNMGQARTLNKGWFRSHGSILGYLSADDILLPGAVSAAVQALMTHPEAVMVYPDCSVIDPHSRIIKRSVCRPFSYESLVVEQECWVGPGAFFRRSVFEEVGGWDTELRLIPDLEFWMRLGLRGSFIMLPRALAAYRMHSDSITYSRTDEGAAAEYLNVMHAFFARTDVPAEILAKKAIAFSHAHIAAARIHLRGRRFARCLESMRTALLLDPKLPKLATAWMLIRTSISRPIHRVIWTLRNSRIALRPLVVRPLSK